MVNSKSLQDLSPEARSRMIFFIARVEYELTDRLLVPVKVVVTSTFRDAESQDALFAQGRTAPGAVVTNAKAGESWHNFQRAMDFALRVNGKVTWDASYYEMAGRIAKECGLTWGGDWNRDGKKQRNDWDLCHVQWDEEGKITLADLQSGARA